MNEFRYLDYCTEYSCEGALYKDMGREACFSYVFHSIHDKDDVTYKIRIHKGVDFCSKNHKSNACIFDKDSIVNHINLLNELYPIEFSIQDDSEDTLIVTMTIKNAPGTFHKYALTWVRYLYEYPYNVILLDAYKLKEDPTFESESIANLFNLGIGCFCHNPRDIHQVPENAITTKLTIPELRQRITEVNRLNSIYRNLSSKRKTIPEQSNLDKCSVYDYEYWTTEKLFEEERKPIYLETYKK